MNKISRQLPPLLLALLLPAAQAEEAAGVLQWRQKAALSLPVSGVVASVHVEPGQNVQRGQTMLTLDKRPFQNRLDAAEARTAQREPGRSQARDELERAEELFDRALLSQVELSQAQAAYAESDAAYLAARAEARQAALELEYSVLKAPFDLTVLEAHTIAGQTVINELQATPLFTVATGELVVALVLPPAQAAGLKAGNAAEVAIGGSVYAGKIAVVDYDQDAQMTRVVARLERQPDAAVGQAARVTW